MGAEKEQKETSIVSILTGTTCGFACWEAREQICRCSCGGKNHGVFARDGRQPEKTCKIDGFRYTLKAVSCDSNSTRAIENEVRAINALSPREVIEYGDGDFVAYPWRESDKGSPAKIKKITEAQRKNWTECHSAWYGLWIKEN